jgi:cyclophilin family peptidyl-prolyl cis-trans isomerase
MSALVLAVLLQAEAPKLADERILLRTSMGDIVLVLYPDVAPKHVAQILRLVKLGVYDGMHFHRVEPGFVAQLSGHHDRATPLKPEQAAAILKIPGEFSPIVHRRGLLSMARFDDPNSAETSFSILLGPAPHLDGKYTVFGHVESGLEVVAKIERVDRDVTRPRRRVSVERAEVVRGPVRPGRTRAAVGAALMAIGFASSFVVSRFTHRRVRTACLLMVLVGFFLLLMEYVADKPPAPVWSPIVVFVGAIAVFRFLATFESPAPKPPKAGP